MSIAVKMDGLVQDCSISTANALEILQSCTNSSKYIHFCRRGYHFNIKMSIYKDRDSHSKNKMVSGPYRIITIGINWKPWKFMYRKSYQKGVTSSGSPKQKHRQKLYAKMPMIVLRNRALILLAGETGSQPSVCPLSLPLVEVMARIQINGLQQSLLNKFFIHRIFIHKAGSNVPRHKALSLTKYP